MTAPTYSIVVPVCDEEGSLPELERRLLAVMEKLDAPSEVILVDVPRRYTPVGVWAR